MSFLKSIVGFATGDGIGSTLARTAVLGYALNRVLSNVNPKNQQPEDPGQRIQLNPNTENSIPVVYGTAFLSGSVTDAALTASKTTMWYCVTICEKTGTKISDDEQSDISIDEIYWNGYRVTLQSDGVTMQNYRDPQGNVNNNVAGLVKFYLFSGNSDTPINITSLSTGNTQPAYNLFPNWTSNHQMNDLVFALVRVDYSKENNITGLGELDFKITNTMSLPGDCLYDYLTNPRYGAGINAQEIFDE